ncbi:dipeptide epimerase [Mongoliibacter ruber]|uniref:Dipeptide epimerase n=1 Tax=Mongoliibacter ruber TaxID=1750599 RepID=A0A2T0WSK8_9BACT|nr:dipeptide epimerase [Mongoliibacter ruber]PRY89670.1 L-alanine-DL-glutamate epimerase-like enolase superfamily enzyme [Mongoliibacter ruber]
MKLSFFVKDLPLKHTFTIAHQSRDVQDTVIVKLEHEGLYGLGETTTNPFYGMTAQNICENLESVISKVEGNTWESPSELWEMCRNDFSANPFAQCALDLAAWDIYTKSKGQKLYEYLGLSPENIPTTNFTIGIDTIEKMVEKMKEVEWPLYKIKLGTDHDLEIIRELRKHTEAVFRIDANCAWTAEQAIIYSEELLKLNVEFMEQPLGKDDLEGMKEVFKYSKLPVIADESCIVESDVKKCSGLFHGINIKLVKAGGITPALRMIKEAKSLGMKCMVGCMTESSVGITAIAHIAPLLDYVDMDGAMLLSKDIARGVVITPDKVTFPEGNGIGAEMV